MTVALLNTNPQPVRLWPVTAEAPLEKWVATLDFLGQEADFYQKLLNIGLHDGSEQQKEEMYELLESFSEYRNAVLPELYRDLMAWSGQKNETPGAGMDFQKKLETYALQFREMKTQVFPLVSAFQKVTIW